MSRLTHLMEYKDKRKNREPMIKIRNKLFELENVEDDLGIDLITLFKALINGFYTIREDLGLITDARLVFNHTYPKFEFIRDDSMYFYNLKDYGKTWALTREELK